MNGIAPVYQPDLSFTPSPGSLSQDSVQSGGGVCLCCGVNIIFRKSFLRCRTYKRKFCSVECREKYCMRGRVADKIKACAHCKSEFRQADQRRLYCSEKCRRREEFGRLVGFVSHEEKNCVACGNSFLPREPRVCFCSKQCRAYHTRIVNNLRGRIVKAMKRHGLTKSDSTMSLTGCDVNHLKQHLESKFQNGMNWRNMGFWGWHIDHIVPCSAFDLTKEDDRKRCFHFQNLQPLWRNDNLSKSNRLDWKPSRLPVQQQPSTI